MEDGIYWFGSALAFRSCFQPKRDKKESATHRQY